MATQDTIKQQKQQARPDKVDTSVPPNRLKEIRTARGLSQKDLARKMGKSPGQITYWESASENRRFMNEENIFALAKVLGVQPGDILPLVLDGSVAKPASFKNQDLHLLARIMTIFIEMNFDEDSETARKYGQASVKFFQMVRNRIAQSQDFDLASIADILAPDQNSSEE